MHPRRSLFAFVCLSTALVGCGDTPYTTLRDTITSWNEMADLAAQLPDDPDTVDEAAEALYKKKVKPLAKKFEAIKKRISDFTRLDKLDKPQVNDAVKELAPESKIALRRVVAEFGGYYALNNTASSIVPKPGVKGRLNDILDRLTRNAPGVDPAQRWPNLVKLIESLDSFTISLPTYREFKPVYQYYGAWLSPRGSQGEPPTVPANPDNPTP